jgi:branched-chain amino acid transport system substrate-binding protein
MNTETKLSSRRLVVKTMTAIGAAVAAPALLGGMRGAHAERLNPTRLSDGIVKIGVLTDLNGPYRDFAGPGSVLATRMAVEEFGGTMFGKPIEVVYADHQNKPDIGSAIAREWFSVGQVDMVVDMPNSGVALAVQQIAREAGRVSINSSASTTDLTGKSCSPTGLHWTSDAYAQAHGTARALMQRGDDTWFFLTVDYTGGYTLEDSARPVILGQGGKVLGSVRHPLNTADFSSYLLQAQSSGAKVVALANGGNDTINAIKQAAEFGLMSNGQQLVGLFVNITDIHSLGLKITQDIIFTTAFYWNLDDQTRAFARRFQARHAAMPSQYQAGIYSAVTHYLKAIDACGTDEALPVVSQMKATPVEDFFARHGHLREDGRMVHDMFLVQVKKPEASTSEWDLYEVLATIPAAEAFRPLSEGNCTLVKKGM